MINKIKTIYIVFTIAILFSVVVGTVKAEEVNNKSKLPNGSITVHSNKKDFDLNENLTFDISSEKNTGILGFFQNLFQKSEFDIKLKNSKGEEIKSENLNLGDSSTITIDTNSLKPGKYTLTIAEAGNNNIITQDFTWGVLALNTDRPVYKTNEKAQISMAVLDDEGKMICNAKADLVITFPDGNSKTLTTDNNSVSVTDECRTTEVTLVPDYLSYFTPEIEGEYKMDLTVYTANGKNSISSSFRVDNNQDFYLKRSTATRVYPRNPYPVYIEIEANKNFKGEISDIVPKVFDIYPLNDIEYNSGFEQSETDKKKIISWNVNFQKGQTYYLGYEYQGPLESPEFYTLGPIQFKNQCKSASDQCESFIFSEGRKWQIAWDAANDLILLWDTANGSVPGGWTSISESAGTYYQKFIRGAATAGGTGGSPTHTHTVTTNIGTSTSTVKKGTTAVYYPDEHTHTPTTGGLSGSNNPQYKELVVVRSSGTPTTIPNNMIALFDDVPASGTWTRESARDGYYIFGEDKDNSLDTGGNTNNQHYHTITISLAADSTADQKTGSTELIAQTSHTHNVANQTTNTVTYTPPHHGILLYRNTSGGDQAIPTGMIGMFDATQPSGWTSLSGSGGDFENRFLLADSTYSVAAGGGTHTHNDITGVTSGVSTANSSLGNGSGSDLSANSHTHSVSLTSFSSIAEADNLPEYVNTIIAKYNPSFITVSGNAYSDEGTTVWSGCDSSTERISLVINGGTASTTSCDSSDGSYSFGSITMTPNYPVSVFFNTAGSSTDKGVAVTVAADNSSNITLNPRKDRVWAKSETGITSVTNTDLDHCDKNSPGDCANVPYAVTTSNLTVDANYELHVEASKTFDPGGTVTLSSGTGDLHVAGNAYMDTASNSIARDVLIASTGTFYVDTNTTVNGGDVTVTTTGVIDRSTGTGKLTMVGGGTVGGGSGNITLYDLESSTSGTTILSGSGTNTITNDLTAGTGTTMQINNYVYIAGNFNNTTTGIISYSGTPTVDMTGDTKTLGGGSGNISLYKLYIDNVNISFSGSGTNSFADDVIVSSDCSFSINSNVTIGGNLNNLTSGTISYSGTPTVTMSGNSKAIGNGSGSGSMSFYNLNITGSVDLSKIGTTYVNNNANVDTGATFNINYPLQIAGNLTNTTTGIIGTTAGTPTVTFTGSATIGGGSGAITFYNLATSGTGTSTFSGSGTNTVNNDVTVGTGTTLNINSDVSIAGNFNNTTSGIISYSSGTPTITMTGGSKTLGTGSGSITLYNLATSGTASVTFSGSGTNTVDNNITVGTGTTLNINSNLLIAGNFTNTTTGIISYSSGTPTVTMTGTGSIGGGSGTITFYNLTTSGTGTTTISTATSTNNNLSISTNTTLALNAGISIGNNYSNSGTLTANSQKVSMIGQDAGNTLSGTMTASSSFYDLEFNDSGTSGAWSFGANSATVTNNFTITGGTVTAPSTTLTIGGNFSNSDGFSDNSGTVVFNDNSKSSTLSYSAATTFNNLTIQTDNKQVKFDDTYQTNVTGAFTVQGSSCDNLVYLDSETDGNQWDIYVSGTHDVDYTDVEDSNAVTTALTANSSIEPNDGNTNWTIDNGACSGPSPTPTPAPVRVKGGVRYNGNVRIK